MKIIRAKRLQGYVPQGSKHHLRAGHHETELCAGPGNGRHPGVGAYAQLVEWYNKGDLDFSEVTTVNLDEYRGLPKEHPESYWSFMHKNLFDHVNIRPEAIHLPDGTNPDAADACAKSTTTSSTAWAASTCSCWASARTATSASTSRAMRLSWRPTASI